MGKGKSILPILFPGCLYEKMLKMIVPFSIRGFLWYQGESDDVPGRQVLYENMLTGLISDWRKLWHQEEIPFLIVQLPGWEHWIDSENQDFATIRRCQEHVADKVKNVYLCSISDAGERNNIHPKNKKIVGHRLALLARGHIYGEHLLCDAPRIRQILREKNSMVISFMHVEGGLKVDGNHINALKVKQGSHELPFSFTVSGENIVLIFETEIKGSVNVEFAQDKWFLVNLYNQADIPAIPFSICCEKEGIYK